MLQGEDKPSREDLQILARSYDTSTAAIKRLLEHGVPMKDVDDVLEVRALLSMQLVFPPHEKLSVEAMAHAYQVAGGDLGELRKIADIAMDLVPSTYYVPARGYCTWLLNRACEMYEESSSFSAGWLPFGEPSGVPRENQEP